MIQIPDLKVTVPELLIIPDMELSGVEAQNAMEHCTFLSEVRRKSGKALKISNRSGIRPVWFEKKMKRSGNSEHSTYDIRERGATDIVFDKDQFALILDSPFYTRICYYPNNGFYHCDRKPTKGRRLYFECQSLTSDWEFKMFL